MESVILGLIQGVTEFLPISSTGHLILGRSLFGLSTDNALAFDAILHLATAAAVIVYFRRDIWLLSQALFRKLGRLQVDTKDSDLLYALAVGTVPAVVLGLTLENLMAVTFRSPLLVAGVLAAGSVFFIYAEYQYSKEKRRPGIGVKTGFKIGLFQSLALIPGVSRAGATIAGGMLLGLSRSEAARFAFLLAVPVILGAGFKKLFELMASDALVAWGAVLIGSLTAFMVGLLAIHFMLSFVRRYTFWPFIWYRLILASLVVLMVVFTDF